MSRFTQTETGFQVNPKGYVTAREMFEDCGVAYDIETAPAVVPDYMNAWSRFEGDQGGMDRFTSYSPSETEQMVYRNDTHEVFRTMKNTYVPFYNSQMIELVDHFVSEYKCELDTVTPMRKGAALTATLFFGEEWTAPGDESPMLQYVNVLNSHDGARSLCVAPGTMRGQCTNLEAFSDAATGGYKFTMRHTNRMSNMHLIKSEVGRLMSMAGESLRRKKEETCAVAYAMPVNREQFLKELFPVTDPDSDIHIKHVHEKRDNVSQLLLTSNTLSDPHNPWQLHQAVVEFDEHKSTRHSEDSRNAVILNGGSDLSRRSWSLIKEMTGVR